MRIKNINPDFGDTVEFASISEMQKAIVACGYAIPADGLKEGRDYDIMKNEYVHVETGAIYSEVEMRAAAAAQYAECPEAGTVDDQLSHFVQITPGGKR
jgi:hypothetical protein